MVKNFLPQISQVAQIFIMINKNIRFLGKLKCTSCALCI